MHEAYNQLDILQWELFVVSRSALAETGRQGRGINRACRLANGPTALVDLASALTTSAIG